MDLKNEVLRENSRAARDRIARWVGTDRKRFAALMDLYLHGDLRTAQLAAGVVSVCTDDHLELLDPWLEKVVARIKDETVHDAVRRLAVRAFQCMDIPPRLAGRVADLCFSWLGDINQPIALRVFSMTALERLARREPDLKNELRLVIEQHLPYSTAAFRARARMTLAALGARRPART